jgi:hypothetical protein
MLPWVALVLGEGTIPQADDADVAEGDFVAKRARRMRTTPLMRKRVLTVKRALVTRELRFITL